MTTVVTGGVGIPQEPGTTVMIVQQPVYGRGFNLRNRAPVYMQQGVRVGGAVLGIHMIICLGVFGGFFIFAGIMAIATDPGPDFWSKFDRTSGPATTAGSILLVIGACLVIACIAVSCFGKKKYEQMRQNERNNPGSSNLLSGENPGHVYNRNPGYPPGVNAPYGGAPVYPQGGAAQYPQGVGSYPQGVAAQYPQGGIGPYPQGGAAPVSPVGGGYQAGQPTPYPPQPGYIPGGATQPFDKPASEYDAPPPYSPGFKPT